MPECAVIVRDDFSGRYYLRREADPESAEGQSATYSCRVSSTTAVETTTTRTLVKRIMVTKGMETFEITTFDWEKLNDNPDMYDQVVEEIKKSVAKEYGVTPDAVDIELR